MYLFRAFGKYKKQPQMIHSIYHGQLQHIVYIYTKPAAPAFLPQFLAIVSILWCDIVDDSVHVNIDLILNCSTQNNPVCMST